MTAVANSGSHDGRVTFAGRLLAKVNVHYRGAGVESGFRLACHFFRRDRDRMLFRIGKHAGERAGDHDLVVHGVSSVRPCAAFASGSSSTRSLTRRDLIAGLDQNLADDPVAFRADLVLHLHGFEHDDGLSPGNEDRLVWRAR